jgi:hypothetical protein
MPPTKRDPDPLVEELADMFVRIETNYVREGTGHGSRFAGERLEVVQARAAIQHIRQADRAYRTGLCPADGCGRTVGLSRHGLLATHYRGTTGPPVRCPGTGQRPEAYPEQADPADAENQAVSAWLRDWLDWMALPDGYRRQLPAPIAPGAESGAGSNTTEMET